MTRQSGKPEATARWRAAVALESGTSHALPIPRHHGQAPGLPGSPRGDDHRPPGSMTLMQASGGPRNLLTRRVARAAENVR